LAKEPVKVVHKEAEDLGIGVLLSVKGEYAMVQFEHHKGPLQVAKSSLRKMVTEDIKLKPEEMMEDEDEVEEGVYGPDGRGGYDCLFVIPVPCEYGKLTVTNVKFNSGGSARKGYGKFLRVDIQFLNFLLVENWMYYPDRKLLYVPSYKYQVDGIDKFRAIFKFDGEPLQVLRDVVSKVYDEHKSQ